MLTAVSGLTSTYRVATILLLPIQIVYVSYTNTSKNIIFEECYSVQLSSGSPFLPTDKTRNSCDVFIINIL